MAKQFLGMHPGMNRYASTGWRNYLNTKEKSPYGGDPLGSLRSALDLFRQRYVYKASLMLVFSVARE